MAYIDMTAKEQFDKLGGGDEPDPLERLRFFCSIAMNNQDWLDVEPLFNDVTTEFIAIKNRLKWPT
jgi:hypothetical protein